MRTTMSCSFHSEDLPCGPAPGQDDVTIIPVKACNKDLSNYFFALDVSGRLRHEKNAQICSEADILFNRADVFSPPNNR